ncbi:hypothetical protein SDRG_00082 [Saprolegnia diclina VS20]|uniref:Phospholipid/glycerol acyltransferase domain-containing protein n=1 Tax=Saprolegnia diclina (strain VS20) TaxID=1156394 RepID=T0QVT6_SAPDV|nr:hypothetical protein SDRG_00082 [Saprolegnia diclina VS20]EQC42344.1 hypothetical protein SDRG_00082 [Saprolegnia diclina VS20]|eukprot:XP_008603767.1 hypothetical protein SDRG_00082 [Saprolegnia diclina VS20]
MAVRSTLACLVLLLVHVVLVTLYASAFALLLPFGRARIRRCIAAYCLVDWVDLLSVLFPVATLTLSGDAPRTATAATPIVLVANHQVDADWWYLQQYVRLVGAVPQLKLCMKSSLAYVPCMGWTMALLEFLFLRRDLVHDKPHVQQYMESFVEDAFPVWLMLFPEGTTIHTECVTKSQAFATAQGRPTLERVLLPGAAGLQLLLDAYANTDVKPEIYDITIGYPSYAGEVPTYEMAATSTRVCPPCNGWSRAMGRRSCICTSRATPLQPSPATIVGFLDRQWSQKEHWLAHFAQHENRHDAVLCNDSHSRRATTGTI